MHRRPLVFALIVALQGSTLVARAGPKPRPKPRLAVLAEEKLNTSNRGAAPLERTLRQALAAIGYDTSRRYAATLRKHGARAATIVSGKSGDDLAAVDVDVVLGASLAGVSEMLPSGQLAYHGRLKLRLVEPSTGRTLASFDGAQRARAADFQAARRAALRRLMQKAWTRLLPTIRRIVRGAGEVRLHLRQLGLPIPAQRLVARPTPEPAFHKGFVPRPDSGLRRRGIAGQVACHRFVHDISEQ